jgi:hypothetical protein
MLSPFAFPFRFSNYVEGTNRHWPVPHLSAYANISASTTPCPENHLLAG